MDSFKPMRGRDTNEDIIWFILKVSNHDQLPNCPINKAIESSLPEQRGIEHSVTKCCHTSAGCKSFITCKFCVAWGESSTIFCDSFRVEYWAWEYKHANVADIDLLTIVMDFIESSSFVGLINYLWSMCPLANDQFSQAVSWKETIMSFEDIPAACKCSSISFSIFCLILTLSPDWKKYFDEDKTICARLRQVRIMKVIVEIFPIQFRNLWNLSVLGTPEFSRARWTAWPSLVFRRLAGLSAR